jgi:hypothetical protein
MDAQPADGLGGRVPGGSRPVAGSIGGAAASTDQMFLAPTCVARTTSFQPELTPSKLSAMCHTSV